MLRELNISTGEVVFSVIALASKKRKIQRFSEDMLYAVFQKLTEEFPNYFQGLHWRFLVGGFPYCGRFEDILFRAGSSGCLLRMGIRMNEFLIDEKIVKAIEESVKKHYGEDTLNKMEVLTERFIELIAIENKLHPKN